MDQIVGHHELTAVPRSLMTADGLLLPGGDGKSLLAKVIKEQAGCNPQKLITNVDAVVIDAMCLLHHTPKPAWVKNGIDLASAFCDSRWNCKECSTILITFDTYKDVSLKDATREAPNKESTTEI